MTDNKKEGGTEKIKTAVSELCTKSAEIIGVCWNFGMHRIEDAAEARVRGKSKGEIARKFDNAAANVALAGNDPAEIRQIQRSFVAEQTQYYANIKAIGDRAIPHIKEGAKAENVHADTIMHLREKSKIISEEDMRDTLAKILAGEINSPGSFSKKTIDVVSSLGRSDVIIFSQLCSFVVTRFARVVDTNSSVKRSIVLARLPFIFDELQKVYQGKGVTFASLQDMVSLGLLSYTLTGLHAPTVEIPIRWGLSGDGFIMGVEVLAGQKLQQGRVMFTRAGAELSRICKSEIVPEFAAYMMEYYKKQGLNCRLVKSEEDI